MVGPLASTTTVLNVQPKEAYLKRRTGPTLAARLTV
jgi:hypothetical protein